MQKILILAIFLLFIPISIASIYNDGIYGSKLYGISRPVITPLLPTNNTAVTIASLNELITFTFNVSKVSNCVFYLDDIVKASITNAINLTLVSTTTNGFGVARWYINCSYKGSVTKSPFFLVSVLQGATTGASAPTTGAGGGDFPPPNPSSPPIQYTPYTSGYICNATKAFIGTKMDGDKYLGYNISDLFTFQEKIYNDTGQLIGTFSLTQYIDYSESYCNVTKNITKKNITTIKLDFPSFNLTKINETKFYRITFQSYLPLGKINIGNPNRFLLGLYRFFFVLKQEGTYFIIGARIITWTFLLLLILAVAYRKRIKKFALMLPPYIMDKVKKYLTYLERYTNYLKKKV